jgi:hypothetical protein
MTNPLRKERMEDEQLTTEDIAQRAQPRGPEAAKPVQSEGVGAATAVPEKRKVTSFPEREASSFPQASRGPELGSAASRPEPASGGSKASEPVNQEATPLFAANESEEFRTRWNSIQASFVDEPRKAVEQADGLVASTMKRLAEVFAQERTRLEQQWDRGDKVSTEDLRVALQRYRAFFHRLLSI